MKKYLQNECSLLRCGSLIKNYDLFWISCFLLITCLVQAQPSSELCHNQIDDDQDGYIDLFDPDCSCDSNSYQAICPVDCEFLPNRYPSTQLQLAWKSASIGNKEVFTPNILVGDVNNDGATEIVVRKTIAINNDENESYIAILKGTDGSLINEFQVSGPNTINQSRELMAMADINRDSLAEFVLKGDNTLKVFNLTGQLIAQSDSLLINEGKHINLADFNGDGIVEAYLGASIYNTSNGKLITYSNLSSGKNPIEYLSGITYSEEEHSIAADLLPEAGLELAAGNMVYKIDINNTNDTSGNTMSPVVANGPVKDGFTTVADINGDQQLDVVVVRGSNKVDNGGIWVWDPRTQEIIAFAYDMYLPLRGSVPFIGDLQGDCTPDIGIAFQGQLRLYQYTGSDTLDRLYSLSTQDVSGMTNMTMFDFNQDGVNELIFRDGEYLRIIDPRSGGLIYREELESGTWTESPVVADIDNDGQAELLVNGFTSKRDTQYIYCFESAGSP